MYFIIGLIYLFGKDTLDSQVDETVNKLAATVTTLFANPTGPNLSQIPFYQNYISSLQLKTLLIANFAIVYLIADFTLFFVLIDKFSEYDQTSELQSVYRFKKL
jgi:hypothetical protein